MKKKILFILPNLNSGGAERVISLLCNNLSRDKFEVVLSVLKKEGMFLRQISKDVKIIGLKKEHVRNSFFEIRKLIIQEKPDIVFSTLSHLNLFLAIFKFLLPKEVIYMGRESSIVSESIASENSKIKQIIMSKLYIFFYNKLEYIICQSKYMADDLIKNYKVEKSKIRIINNPVDIEKIESLSSEKIEIKINRDKINLVTVGRLTPVKQYCYLLDMFSKLDMKKYHLYIIGDGTERNVIENKIKKLGLENNVSLLGNRENPFSIEKQCDIFILTSKYEGFPNSVLEALALGLPILTLKSPGGILEIIKDGENGYFFEDRNFEEKLEKILEIDKKNLKSVVENYKIKKILEEYTELFYEKSF